MSRENDAYQKLFDALKGSIEPSLIARMLAADGPAADTGEVRLIPIGAVASHEIDIYKALTGLTDDASYRFKMVQANLASCLFYVSRREFYIRPMIPPTFQHDPFTDPTQRLYLSATLGDAGELERSFGRAAIKRVPVPPAWDRTGSGRRFFVFPELSPPTERPPADDDAPGSKAGLLGELLDLADKRLVLTPDDDSANKIAELLGVPAGERFTAKNAETGIEPFLDAETGTLLAANRYDGMDLAAESCRRWSSRSGIGYASTGSTSVPAAI